MTRTLPVPFARSPLPDGPTATDLLRTTASVVMIAASVAAERIRRPKATDLAQTPATLESITPIWLSQIPDVRAAGARVTDITWSDRSDGTSSRARLHLTYDHDVDLPMTMFAKSTPNLVTRIANGLSGTSETEAGFYRDIRPRLDIEAPRGYHSSTEVRSRRSVHLLEDMAATKGAGFCAGDRTRVTRDMAEGMVDTLAAVHGSSAARNATDQPPAWLGSYRDWWSRGIRLANLRKYHRRGLTDAGELVAPELSGRHDDTWEAFIRSIERHESLDATLLHNDVHLGNWYQTADGRMGLADWQCCAIGHWSRDLAYCLASSLDTEDRRAWEVDLIRRYTEALTEQGNAVDNDEAFDLYRQQLAGALLMWTPTYSPPRLFPDMQPRSISSVMVQRITTAMADLDTLGALA